MIRFPEIEAADPPDNGRLLSLARHQLTAGQPARALATLARIPPSEAVMPELFSLRSLAEHDLERYEDAERSARRALRADASHQRSRLALSLALLGQGKLAAAEHAILGCLAQHPEDAFCLAVYADVCVRDGQVDKAENLLRWARRSDPECGHARLVEWKVCFVRGDKKRARDLVRAGLADTPEGVQAHVMAGAMHLVDADLRKARRHYANAVALNPADHDVAKIARTLRTETSWPMVPLLFFRKFGTAGAWFVGVGGASLFGALGFPAVAGAWSVTYLTLCVYSWIVPPVVRWWHARRSL